MMTIQGQTPIADNIEVREARGMSEQNRKISSVSEFEHAYAERAGVSVEYLHEHGRYGVTCDCGESLCEGFAMAHAESYGSADEPDVCPNCGDVLKLAWDVRIESTPRLPKTPR